MSPPEDVLLLLTTMVRSERASLANLARAEGLDAENAVDCVQDAFCTFLQMSIRGELPVEDERAKYLAGIVRNTARNKRRRHHVARPHEAYESIASESDASDALLVHAEEHVRLRACVAELCDTQRAVVTLRMLEERNGEDVAATLGITRAHVDVLLHRAKGSLRVCMMHER